MNEMNINAELLAAGSRGRKHIPMAVFAVIVIHVALFLVLLIAAGCRAKAKAQLDAAGSPVAASQAQPQESPTHPALMPAGVEPAAATPAISSTTAEPVIASEPVVERERVSAPGPQRTAQRALPSRPRADGSPGPTVGEVSRVYVVQAGDTIGKIAKDHGVTVQSIRQDNKLKKDVIFPGQKLRVNARKPSRQLASI